MKGQLIYVMGPSGAGKDTLLAWLRNHLPVQSPVHLARRTITRPLQPGDEQHHCVDAPTFQRLCDMQAFALEWQANGLHYGVQHSELAPLNAGRRVIVNGSRAYLTQALKKFPDLKIIHVTTSIETLRARLLARGREAPDAVEARIHRAFAFQVPDGAIEVYNDGSLEDAGMQFLKAFEQD